MSHSLAPALRRVSLALGGLAAAAPLVAAGNHENEDIGYRIRTPRDFEVVAEGGLNVGGGWMLGTDYYVVDRFECSKEIPPTTNWWPYKRQMITFWFPERSAADLARLQAEEQKAREAGDGPNVRLSLSSDRIYNSFEEFAKTNISGFFFDGVEEKRVAGFDARLHEMKFEKLTNVEQRWLACAYEVPGGEFAVLFSCTAEHFDKFRGESLRSFSTFEISGDEGLKVRPMTSGIDVDLGDDVDESKLSAAELLKRREEQREEAFEECLANLEPGWRHFETDHYLIVYECDPRYAKEVARHAEAVRDWLETEFGSIGRGLVQSAIIRVYENEAKIPSRSGFTVVFGGGWEGRVQEFAFGRPDSRGFNAEFDGLSRRVLSHWFGQKNRELWNRMPAWLSAGLGEYVEDAELKGSRLRFGRDEWEKDRLVDLFNEHDRHEGDASRAPFRPLPALLGAGREDLWSGPAAMYASTQSGAFVRYLIDGPGRRMHLTKGLLVDYVGHLYAIVDEIETRLEKEREESVSRQVESRELSEEERLRREDEEYEKRRQNAWSAVERELVQRVFEDTFADWSEDDWKGLQRSFEQYARSL